MNLARYLARQLRQPFGPVGRYLMGGMLNKANAPINRYALETLDARPDDNVLEIGFGGGAALEQLLRTVSTGRVHGAEISDAMLDKAQKQFQPFITNGRLTLCRAGVEALPFAPESFDAVISVNTLYFWQNPQMALDEIRRVLKPGGRLVLGIHSRDSIESPITRHGYTLYTPEEALHLVEAGGFRNPMMEHRDRRSKIDSVIVSAEA